LLLGRVSVARELFEVDEYMVLLTGDGGKDCRRTRAAIEMADASKKSAYTRDPPSSILILKMIPSV